MFSSTDTDTAPWFVAPSDDKKKVRLHIISHMLSKVPYKDVPRENPALPARQKRGDYRESDHPTRVIPGVH